MNMIRNNVGLNYDHLKRSWKECWPKRSTYFDSDGIFWGIRLRLPPSEQGNNQVMELRNTSIDGPSPHTSSGLGQTADAFHAQT